MDTVLLGEDGGLYGAADGQYVSDGAIGWSPRDCSVIGWAYDPQLASANTVLTGGTVYLVRLNLRAPVRVSTIHWGVGAAGVTATAGQNFVGLYSSAGARLATTGVDSPSESTGLKSTAITPVDVGPGFVWVGMVFNAGTVPGIARCSNGMSAAFLNFGTAAATARCATAGTSQTSLPSSITPGSNTLLQNSLWAAIS